MGLGWPDTPRSRSHHLRDGTWYIPSIWMFIRRRSVLNDAPVHHLTQKRTVWYPAQPVSTLLLKPVLFTHCSSSSSSSSIHETFYTSCSYTETVFIHFYTHVCMLNYVGWSFWCFSRSCDVMPPYLLHAGVKMCFGDSVVCNRFIYSCAFTQTMFFKKNSLCFVSLRSPARKTNSRVASRAC